MEAKLPIKEVHVLKTVMRVFEYEEKIKYKYLSTKTTMTGFDEEYIRFELMLEGQAGIVKEPYRIKRQALMQEEHPTLFVEEDIPEEEEDIITPEDKLLAFKIQRGAIVVPEGMKGRELRQVNNAFKLKILKQKKRLKRRDDAVSFHKHQNILTLEQKAKTGQLKLIGKHLKGQ